jgi:hypothetical protein
MSGETVMATRLKVTFDDGQGNPGQVLEVTVTPRAQVNAERFLQGIADANAIQAGYRLAFESLLHRRLINSGLGYEEWLDSILDCEEIEEDQAAENPTPEGASPTPSSD